MSIYLIGQKSMNTKVSHLEGVIGAVYKEALEIAGRAEANLATHRYLKDTSKAEIEVDRGDVDTLVSLVDPGAKSIEFGHRHWRSKKPVRGLYIVTGAAGLT